MGRTGEGEGGIAIPKLAIPVLAFPYTAQFLSNHSTGGSFLLSAFEGKNVALL